MRALLSTFAGFSAASLFAASLLAAGAAGATSIENVASGQDGNSSVSQLSCAHCPPPVVKKKSSYVVPTVAPGTDRVELKMINGEMKVVRTEAWLGGSPVVFVRTSEAAIKAAKARIAPEGDLQGTRLAAVDATPVEAKAAAAVTIIDRAAMTGALDTASTADMAAITPQDGHSQEVDLQKFELRLK